MMGCRRLVLTYSSLGSHCFEEVKCGEAVGGGEGAGENERWGAGDGATKSNNQIDNTLISLSPLVPSTAVFPWLPLLPEQTCFGPPGMKRRQQLDWGTKKTTPTPQPEVSKNEGQSRQRRFIECRTIHERKFTTQLQPL
jgi:hypothetical protein